MPPLNLWRIELLHPALVHFPIAFLIGASLCVVLSIFSRSKKFRARLERFFAFQLFLGTIGAWLAVWSGEQAHEIVNRVICDPTVTHVHSDWGWRTAYLTSVALVFLLLSKKIPKQRKSLALFAAKACLLAAVGTLLYGAHLGSSLVYLQAAAVHRPDDECTEFSE